MYSYLVCVCFLRQGQPVLQTLMSQEIKGITKGWEKRLNPLSLSLSLSLCLSLSVRLNPYITHSFKSQILFYYYFFLSLLLISFLCNLHNHTLCYVSIILPVGFIWDVYGMWNNWCVFGGVCVYYIGCSHWKVVLCSSPPPVIPSLTPPSTFVKAEWSLIWSRTSPCVLSISYHIGLVSFRIGWKSQLK